MLTIEVATAELLVDDLQTWKALKEVRDMYHERYGDIPVGNDVAKSWNRIKRIYEKYSITRNIVAHSRCVDSLNDSPNYILFLSFEKHSD